MAVSALIGASVSLLGSLMIDCQCEASSVGNSDRSDSAMNEDTKTGDLPTYTMAQVSKNNGKGSDKRVWMTYGGNVYDTTDFIANHPGGSEKILLAAGGPVEPHWHRESLFCVEV